MITNIKVNPTPICVAFLCFLLILSGRFTTERVGLPDFELRLLVVSFMPLAFFLYPPVSTLKKPGIQVVIFVFFFFLLALFSALFNLAGDKSIVKIIDIAWIFLVIVILFYFFSKEFLILKWFLIFFAFVGGIYALLAILSAASGGRGSIVIGGPNVATRVIFLGGLSFLFIAKLHNCKKCFFVFIFYIMGVVAIGSRGGMVAAFTCMVLLLSWHVKYFFLSRNNVKKKIKTTLFLLINITFLSVIFYLFLFPYISHVFESRFIGLVVNKLHLAGRDSMYTDTLSSIMENPIVGLGLGGHEHIGIASYPHNLVLEMLIDGGIFFMPLLFWIVASTFRSFLNSDSSSIFLSIGVAYMFAVQQVSGDYYDFRYFFVFLIAFHVFHARGRQFSTQVCVP